MNPIFKIGKTPGFVIYWNVPEERINSRTGKTYIKQIAHEFVDRDRGKVEAKKTSLEKQGFAVTGPYDGLFNI